VSADQRQITLSYRGLDGHTYQTHIWSPEPMSQVRVDRGLVELAHSDVRALRQLLENDRSA
jgi:hypothetical protein